MRRSFFILFAVTLAVALSHAKAETASEIPLTNPEVLEPPSRPDAITPPASQRQGKHKNEQTADVPMTVARMAEIVRGLDEDAVVQGNAMLMELHGVQINVIADPVANRMRAFAPFATLDGVDGQIMYRMLQANFDSALDARYAIAKGRLISVFIHPLSQLQKNQFIEGLGQVVNLVKTYGTAFTSGAITYGGGDSRGIHRKLIEELLKKGEDI